MIPVTSFAGKTVAVFGLGGSALASCHALKAGGADVIASDDGVDRLAERLGPDAADRLIPPIAMTMRRQARSADSLARLSPTRFAALMPDTDEVKAINYIERVRSACDVWLEAGAVSLRLSIGWAEINANQPVEPAIQAAEQRLNMERHRLRSRDAREVDTIYLGGGTPSLLPLPRCRPMEFPKEP